MSNRITLAKVKDGLQNLVANLGTSKDKRSHSSFVATSVMQNELESLYTSNWIAGKTVDIPVEDMLRNWRKVIAPSLTPKQLEEYTTAEETLKVQESFAQGGKWARLYGGAVILLGIDGAGPMDTPLNLDKVTKGSLKFMHVVDRWDVSVESINETDASKSNFRMPEFYRITGGITRIHHSRVLRFDGIDVPWRIRQTNNYWGISILQRVYDAILNAGTVSQSIASMTYEASIDVVQVKNLFQQLSSPGGTEKVIDRFALADVIKSNNNMLILDETETYNKSTVQFGALPDIMTRFLNAVAAAADVPATRLLGQSAQGLNATGEGDLTNYYNMVSSKQEVFLAPQLRYLDEILTRSVYGAMPEDWTFEFNPLWQLSPQSQATVDVQNAQRDEIYLRNEVVTAPIVAEELRENKTYNSLDDEYIEVLEEIELEKENEPDPLPFEQQSKPATPEGDELTGDVE